MMIKNFINNIKFWYSNARPYSAPITLLCWLLIFVYSLKQGGNAILGIIAYLGIAVVHLATNLSDDYFDYKRLAANGEFTNNEKTIKCKYLRNGQATIQDLRNVIIIMLSFAAVIGLFLFFAAGWGVAIFALCTLPIALFYSKLSSRGLGDLAVILAYGPLMYGGVYYVMTGRFSPDVLFLSISSGIFVNTILYAHMLMDYDSDVESGKTTLCTRLKTKDNALEGLLAFYITGYIFIAYFGIRTSNYYYFLTFLTIPLVFDLYNSLKMYNENPKSIPKIYPWHYPLEDWEDKLNSGSAPFFFRFLYTRNISTYYMLLACLATFLK
ncbi:prenyltransferase [bacterium]|nr:prenyltransferase [bacterium]